ncbi:MAG TPA: heparinase II/III family protein [Bacilli bacterium]
MNQNQLYSALRYGTEQGGIMGLFPEGKDKNKWKQIQTDGSYTDMLEEIVEAERLFSKTAAVLPFSVFRLYEATGNRKEFENLYFERRKKLSAYAILSLVYGEANHISALEDILWAICDEFTWSLPAHLGGCSLVGDRADNPRCRIDLFAAETAFYLAEIVHLLEDKLADMVVHRIRYEVNERIFSQYGLGYKFDWETSLTNWAAVCGGGVGAAAIYMISDEVQLAQILERILHTMNSFLSGYADDGACHEGIGYWRYGFGYYVYFSQLLKERTAGQIDLMHDEKVKQVALFQQKCFLGEDRVVNFADALPTYRFHIGLTHRLNQIYPEIEVPSLKHQAGFHDDHCYRWGSIVRNFVWGKPDIPESLSKEAFYFLADTEVVVSRSHLVSFAAKGGHNDEFHNHNDVGHFVLYMKGETLLADAGGGEYTRDYFGDSRYSFLGNGSQGHSVPVINGRYQSAGRKFAAANIQVSTSREQDEFSCELAGAYGLPELDRLHRRFLFRKQGEHKLVIEDRFISNK